jgi:hypothetical protein
MPVSINGNLGITFPDGSLQTAAASPLVLRNRIINGDMRIDQRNAGASVTNNNTGIQYSLDRWLIYGGASSKFTVQQNAGSVTPPVGFTNYLGVTSSAATSIGAGDIYEFIQYIEGYNIADLGWGTANAKTITISFWVRSSLTGTFGGSLVNGSGNRSYPFTYTISSANTWEQKSITIAGDTTGTWGTGSTTGIQVTFGLGVGSTYSGTAGSWQAGNFVSATGATSVVSTSGATFYITGVQLEQNTSATPFERRLYNQELANCQRYYWRIYSQANYTSYGNGWNAGTSSGAMLVKHPVTMRAKATSIDYSLLSSTVLGASEALVATATLDGTNYAGTDTSVISITSSALFTTGFATLTAKNSTSSYLGLSAEL